MKFLGLISGEELLISYTLNQIDTFADTSGVVHITFHKTCNLYVINFAICFPLIFLKICF